MASFRETKTDRDNIDTIILQRGGISRSDAIRVALAETATGKPQLTLLPQLPPIKDVEKAVGELEQHRRMWQEAIRVGWPDHLPGESDERKEKVEAARKFNDQALAKCGPSIENMRALLASLQGASRVDLPGAKRGAEFLKKDSQKWSKIASDSKSSPENRKIAETNFPFWAPLLQFLHMTGLVFLENNNSAPKKMPDAPQSAK